MINFHTTHFLLKKTQENKIVFRHSNENFYVGGVRLDADDLEFLRHTGTLKEGKTVKTEFDTYTYYRFYKEDEGPDKLEPGEVECVREGDKIVAIINGKKDYKYFNKGD